jgi:hypothetical protein
LALPVLAPLFIWVTDLGIYGYVILDLIIPKNLRRLDEANRIAVATEV